ncbi:MAG: 16S rRNA (cytosine(1402)-N(4))-methyltransferase, partial [Kiritimatiellaeota bacterium]|nr:16S rRNA (cytosine(1402)-N(4))-methyltransferase [Kiritimatiellota bacterium]
HTVAIAEQLGPDGRLLALDRDEEAVARVRERLMKWEKQVYVEHANYSEIETLTQRHGLAPVDGVLLDLGMSSFQLETARGFSFAGDAALDMRMDRTQTTTAADLVQQLDEAALA